MVIFPYYVLQVNEAAKVGYAPSWILGSNLETTKFLVVTSKYFQEYPHLGSQHQSLSAKGLIL
jgi:hypothetical protein